MVTKGTNQVPVRLSQPLSRILVTGAPRSGTTWVGNVLAAGKDTLYLHEPFNPSFPSPYTRMRMRNWFARIDPDVDRTVDEQLRQLLDLKFKPCSLKLADLRHPRSLAKRLAKCTQGLAGTIKANSILIKDPIAVLSSDVICERYDVKPIFLIRNPAACVSSIVSRGWRTDYTQLHAQRDRLESLIPDEIPVIERLASDPTHSSLENAAYLWRIINLCVYRFLEMRPDWILVHHEDLLKDPISRFKSIFKQCDLDWNKSNEDFIRNSILEGEMKSEDQPDVFNVRRNHEQLISVARDRLSPEQIAQIEEITHDVVELFKERANPTEQFKVAN